MHVPSREHGDWRREAAGESPRPSQATFGTVAASGSARSTFSVISDQTTVGRIRYQHKDVERIQLSLGFPTVGHGHIDEAPLKLLSAILAEHSSRLFVEVRESAACVTRFVPVVRIKTLNVYGARRAMRHVSEAMKVITDELRNVATDGVTAEELTMVKENVRGGLSLSLEDSADRAEFYGRQALFLATIEEPKERLKKFDAVTLEDIARVAKQYLRFDRMSLAAIGPFASEDELRALLPHDSSAFVI